QTRDGGYARRSAQSVCRARTRSTTVRAGIRRECGVERVQGRAVRGGSGVDAEAACANADVDSSWKRADHRLTEPSRACCWWALSDSQPYPRKKIPATAPTDAPEQAPQRHTGSDSARWRAPDSMVTLSYKLSRLNQGHGP